MSQRLYICICVGLLLGITTSLAFAGDTEDQRAVANRFLQAYFQNDYKTVGQLIPADRSKLFNPYPFAADPKLSQPKVRKKQALVEFDAPTSDKCFMRHGGIVFYHDNRVWKVRQILFYDKVPLIFGLPSKSTNDKERGHEPRVAALCRDFLRSWKANDMKSMLSMWYEWPIHNQKAQKGLSISNFRSRTIMTRWNDPYVSYTAKVTYTFGILSYSMDIKGGLVLFRDGDAWKVRGNHFVFDF